MTDTATADTPRLAIDGPVSPRTGPFRHTRSPRARRRAREGGGDRPRLAVDGPRTPRTGPFRHVHPPRSRRRADELGIDLATVDGTGPAGRVTVSDIERAASTPSAGPTTLDSAPSTAPPPTSSAPSTATDTWSTRRLDLGAVVAAAAADTGAAGVTDRVLHQVLLQLPALVADAHAGPVLTEVERAGGTVTLSDGHDLTLEGLLRRLGEGGTTDAGRPTVTVHDGSLRGAVREVPPRRRGEVVAIALGAISEELLVGRDAAGYQTMALRPTCELTVRFDHGSVSTAALRRFLDTLQDQLGAA